MHKELLAAAAIVLTFAMFVPYIRSIHQGRTKPHAFSWIIWSLGTLIVFFAQSAARGGFGAWPIGVSGLITAYIAVLAYRRHSDRSITKTDWVFLTIALAALPCWFLTSNPLAAVLLLTAVDLAGFGPTFRAAYASPHDERLGFYSLGVARNGLAIAALQEYSVTTVLFPAAVGVACAAFVTMVAIGGLDLRARERRMMSPNHRHPMLHRRELISAVLLMPPLAVAQEPLCNPCIDGPEMFRLEFAAPADAKNPRCGIGSVLKTYGGTEWMLSECSNGSLRILPAPGNPTPHYFLFRLAGDRYELLGAVPEDRGARAAHRDLRALSSSEIQSIVREIRESVR